jgi:hypothetical protein
MKEWDCPLFAAYHFVPADPVPIKEIIPQPGALCKDYFFGRALMKIVH